MLGPWKSNFIVRGREKVIWAGGRKKVNETGRRSREPRAGAGGCGSRKRNTRKWDVIRLIRFIIPDDTFSKLLPLIVLNFLPIGKLFLDQEIFSQSRNKKCFNNREVDAHLGYEISKNMIGRNLCIKKVKLKAAATDMRYFPRSKLSRSLVHKKNFSLIWQVVLKLGYSFCQER